MRDVRALAPAPVVEELEGGGGTALCATGTGAAPAPVEEEVEAVGFWVVIYIFFNAECRGWD